GVDTASKLASAASTIGRVEESGALVYPIQYDTEGQQAGPWGPGPGRMPPPIFRPSPFPRFPRGRRGRWPFDAFVNWQFPRGSRHEDYVRAAQYLRDLADRSGARLYRADTTGNLKKAFAQIAEELRHQYSLSYYPTNTTRDGSYRRIRVRVEQPNLVARARRLSRGGPGAGLQPANAGRTSGAKTGSSVADRQYIVGRAPLRAERRRLARSGGGRSRRRNSRRAGQADIRHGAAARHDH